MTNNGKSVAECVTYADTTANWGPVTLANVILGGEPQVQVPIQIIDPTFGDVTNCSGAQKSPALAGYNGILGVGLFSQDCGATNCNNVKNGMYFTCNGASCTGFAPSLAQQVTNPVSALPQDNNGVIVELPSLLQGGEQSAAGYLVLGIGTQSNNTPGQVTVYSADPIFGEFSTALNGSNFSKSFLDSGTNTLAFAPPPAIVGMLPDCGSNSNAPGFLCPASTLTFTANTVSFSKAAKGSVTFMIGNTLQLDNSPNNVFMEIGTKRNDGGDSFDWGLPFFFGRNVYVGIEGTTSSLGLGPYWAY